MSYQAILSNDSLNKTQKAKALFELGYSRRDVATWITNGNYGFAHNIRKKWNELRVSSIVPLPFEFTFQRTFGIELEIFGATRQMLISKLRDEGINVQDEAYNHNTRNHWKIVTDGSIRGEHGNEIVSPVLRGMDGIEHIKKVCIALGKSGAQFNKTCGFHVHLGANDLNLENMKALVRSYINLENPIDAIMPESRRGNSNSYCKNLTSVSGIDGKISNAVNITQLVNAFGGSYFKLNLQSITRHGTVEFRQHSGTITFSKIKNWLLICARIVEYARVNGVTNNMTYFLNESLQDYVSDRAIDVAV